jgi:hypothetical protein
MADLSPEQLQGLADALTGTARASNDLTREQQNQVQRQRELQESLRKTREYFADLGSTLISTERGTSKYATAITGATDAAAGVASQFGALGIAAGYVIKALGGIAAASLKQNDALIKTFKTLSDFGAVDLDTNFEGLNKQLLKLGYTAETSQEFSNTLRKIAPELAMFGGTVSAGAKQFIEAGAQLTGPAMQKQLYNLGYTNEQILDYAGSFIARNTKNQTLLDKSTGNVANQSFGYLKTLTELTALTGASRDQAEEAARAQQLELGWRLHIAEIARTAPEEADKLQKSMQLQLLTNRDMAMTVMDQIVNNGAITTENSARNMNLVGDTYLRTIEMSKRKGNDAVTDTANILNSRLPAIDAHIAQFSATGKISADAAKELGLNVGLLDSRARLLGYDEKTIAKLRTQIDQMMGSTNSRLTLESQEEQAARKRRETTEELTRQMGDYMVPGVTKFSILVNQAALGLAKFIRTMSLGTIDFVDNFRDFSNLDEVKEALAEYQRKDVELIKKRVGLEQDLTDALAIRAKQVKDDSTANLSPEVRATRLKYADDQIKKAREKLAEVDSATRANRINTQQATQTKNTLEKQNTGGNGGQAVVGPQGSTFAGIKIKPGDTHTEGSQLDSRLPGLAKKISELFGDAYITSVNDEFHRSKNIDPVTGKVRKSKHTTGEALDFALSYRPSPEEGNRIVDQLIGLGFKSARDEYNNPSDGATGNHFHAELATGGIVRGPKTGYPAMLHGTEAVLPMNMLKDFGNQITKFPFTSGSNMGGTNDMDSLLRIMEQVYGKIEEMVDYQRATKFVQEDILVQVKH